MNKKIAVVSCSGGMDSTGLLMRLLADGYETHVISYFYGQKHSVELDRLEANIEYLRANNKNVVYNKVDTSSIMGLYHSALTSSDIDVPEGHYESENMKSTVVPNRNAIFASMVYGYALSLSARFDTDVKIALGVHSGDHAIYPDCTPQFYKVLGEAFAEGNWGSERVAFHLPYIDGNKLTILEDSLIAINDLGLDFDTVFRNSNTCYAPDEEGRSCGACGSCTERLEAFSDMNRTDPVQYKK